MSLTASMACCTTYHRFSPHCFSYQPSSLHRGKDARSHLPDSSPYAAVPVDIAQSYTCTTIGCCLEQVSIPLADEQYTADIVELSQNLTLIFYPQPPESCSFSNSTDALTFTTGSIPDKEYCFNFPDIVEYNGTSAYTNQTTTHMNTNAGIDWQIENASVFNASMNYSSILYRQWSGSTQVGSYGNRRVTLYSTADCKDDARTTFTGPESDPSYGFGCWSPSEGSCGTAPYSVASFKIGPGDNDESGACSVFTKLEVAATDSGAANVQYSTAASVLVAVSVILWVML